VKVESIRVKNFKVFKEMSVSALSSFSVFLGVNGAGKSALFQIFGFLADALRTNVTTAINNQGGFHEVITRGTPLNQAIEFVVRFRDRKENGETPLVTYELKIGWENQKAVVLWEVLKHRRDRSSVKPWNFLMFQRGRGYVINNEGDIGASGAREQRDDLALESADRLAIKGSGALKRYQAITDFRNFIEGWRLLDLQDEALGMPCSSGAERRLASTGSNLAQATKLLQDQDPEQFKKVLAKMSQRFSGLEDIKTAKTKSGQIQLQFKDEAYIDAIPASSISSGILRMCAYLVLCHDPFPFSLLFIEEPERHLHPDSIPTLAKELREYARRGCQVFVSTHSPAFVNFVLPSELHFVRKKSGGSLLARADHDPKLKARVASGHRLGNLWQRGLIAIGEDETSDKNEAEPSPMA